jgi:hypothetical protein
MHIFINDPNGCREDTSADPTKAHVVAQMLSLLQWTDGSYLRLWTEWQPRT